MTRRPSLNIFLDILLTNFFKKNQRVITLKLDITRKKNGSAMRNPYIKFQESIFNGLKITVGTKKGNACTHGRILQKQYALPTFSKLVA